MTYTKFSLVLRQCRANSGLTQKQVADALGLERSTYAYYEAGVTHPSCDRVIKLSRIFNVDYRIFMDAVGDTKFDNSDEDESFTTLTEKSWEDGNKIYELTKSEQNLIIAYRLMDSGQKKELINFVGRDSL